LTNRSGLSLLYGIVIALLMIPACREPQSVPPPSRLLIRCDDIGMCHTVNLAAEQLLESGLPVSMSVMFVCPWYQEAVAILKEHPEISVGVHLTLNAEWKNYRWGPVSGAKAVPSLVDNCGYFFPTRADFHAAQPDPREVESELRAQIERGLASGLRIDYVDYHMGTAVSTPELLQIVEKLAGEYKLGISRGFGEQDLKPIYSVLPEEKTDSLLVIIDRIPLDRLNLMVFHIGQENPEMDALIDMNEVGLAQMSHHRNAELRALLSHGFHQKIQEKNVQLLTYRELIDEVGLENVKLPEM